MATLGDTDQKTILRVYLNDHRAGAGFGLSLARRCLGSNAGSPLGELLEQLVAEIAEDDQALASVADTVSAVPNPLKRISAIVAERVGRLKPNGRLRGGYTPLARLLEIEALE